MDNPSQNPAQADTFFHISITSQPHPFMRSFQFQSLLLIQNYPDFGMTDQAPTSTSNSEVKYYSLNTSQGEKCQKSLSARKKPFTRKPAAQSCSSQTRRKSREVFIQNFITDGNQVDIEPFVVDSTIKINFVKRKERQTEFYNKQKEGQTSGRGKKDTSFSPFSSSKKNLQENASYFYKKPAGKQCDTISNSQNCSQAYFSGHNSTKLIHTMEKTELRSNNEEETPQGTPIKKKAEFQFTNPPVLTFSYSKTSRLNVLSKNNQKVEKPKLDNPTVFECSYCKNNKEMTDIMCEKYSKLQEQLKAKNQKIKELTAKYETIKEQHMKLSEKYEHKLEASQLKEIQFFREREELMNRIDAFKSDLTKICEKLKYTEIENSMLLRYKDEYQLLTKEYDIIVQENQRLQNSIAQMRKGDRDDFFKKNKVPTTSNSKNHQKIHLSNQKFSIQDDLMSLSLSQQSIDHF